MQSPRDWETRRKRRRRAGGSGPVLVVHMPRTVTSLWDQSEMNAARWVRGAIACHYTSGSGRQSRPRGGERRCCPSPRASADRVPIANERRTSEINSGSERQSNPVCGEAEQRRRNRDFCSRVARSCSECCVMLRLRYVSIECHDRCVTRFFWCVSRAYANAPHPYDVTGHESWRPQRDSNPRSLP